MPAAAAGLSAWALTAAGAGETQGPTHLPPGFVRLAEVAPTIVQDMRYAGDHNFTGRRVPGYASPECWLRRDAAKTLALAQAYAEAQGQRLIVYDCYRPQQATDAFMRWAGDGRDQIAKGEFYPAVDKRSLFAQGYIARRSTHSTGLAVDVGMIDAASGRPLDFGTPFDRFDPRSATADGSVRGKARENRMLLNATMARFGFENLKNEWWHYFLPAATTAPVWDVEIR